MMIRKLRDRQGKCSSCGNQALAGKTRCQACTEKASARSKKSYQDHKALGVCPQCKRKPVEPGLSCCRDCLDYHAAKTEKNREANAPRQREHADRWRAARLATGTCPHCNKRSVRPGRTTCQECGQEMSRRMGKVYDEARNVVLAHYGSRCMGCGEAEIQFLQVDHIEGGGTITRPGLLSQEVHALVVVDAYPT